MAGCARPRESGGRGAAPLKAKERVRRCLESLGPGAFSFVMATGSVSVAAAFTGVGWAEALFRLNQVAYPLLLVLVGGRLALRPRAALEALGYPVRGPGFLTVVPATSIVGAQFLILGGAPKTAAGLWVGGLALWAVLSYGFLVAVVVRPEKPGFDRRVRGGWLVLVVGTQSVAAVGARLSGAGAVPTGAVEASLVFFLSGPSSTSS